jgi:phosphohistidine phosphatase
MQSNRSLMDSRRSGSEADVDLISEQMKTIYLIRHAKSSWNEPDISDFERPLNERGRRDAPRMAEKLRHRGAALDHILSSTSKRALSTAEAFAREFDISIKKIRRLDELYLAPPDRYLTAIESLDDRFAQVAIVGHNEGITDFANALGVARIDNMPTCSVFAISVDVQRWRDFRSAPKEFLFFLYPKDPLDPFRH